MLLITKKAVGKAGDAAAMRRHRLNAAGVSDSPRRSEHAAHREAGKRVKRFNAASSFCAIRDLRISNAGACRDGRRANRVLLAAGAKPRRSA
jgi:hypothetical protein